VTLTTVPVIFDLDGTLVDPAQGISDGIAAALTELGLAVPGQAGLDAMIGPKLSHSLLDIAGVPADQLEEAIRIYRAHYLSTGIAQSRLYPGIRTLLESYVDAGRPIAVATQKPEGLARIVLEHHGIDGCFRFIRGSAADEATPAQGPAGKAGIVAAALADLGTQHAVMVGDRAQDVAGAAANGLDCIGVAWGFALDGELREAGAVEIVHSTRALHDTISRLDTVRTSALMTEALNGVHTDGNV
jgi:phosphoglycolate phosphatase